MITVGSTLDGRYALSRVLGQGAEGTVFEAVHTFTGQRFAVKVAAAPATSDPSKVRLLREARALGHLRHPGIVSITDAGISDGYPFVVMELLEGRTLEGLLAARDRLSVADAVGAALQVCDALKMAHAVGVVHRDVKPANVIVAWQGDHGEKIKLLDFGTSKPTDPTAARVTAAGALVGTPAYMAPEQLLAKDVDERADIYAVGVLLFECLAGAVPYEGSYPQVLMAACNDEPPPSVRTARADVDGALEGVIAKALAKNPTHRHASAAQFAAALQRACPQVDGRTRLLETTLATGAQPRRKFLRAPYLAPVRIISSSGDIDGRCEDISEGGMLVLSDRACAPDEQVSVRFALPIEGKIVSCAARVQWVRGRPDRPQAPQALGLEFLDLGSNQRASISRYVALMAPQSEGPQTVGERASPASHVTLVDTPAGIRRSR